MATGNLYGLYLKSDGSLWGMGINIYGELGDGSGFTHSSPFRIESSGVVEIAASSGGKWIIS